MFKKHQEFTTSMLMRLLRDENVFYFSIFPLYFDKFLTIDIRDYLLWQALERKRYHNKKKIMNLIYKGITFFFLS